MKKLRWGVIGAGGIADRRTIPGMMLANNAELIAVMEINMELAESPAPSGAASVRMTARLRCWPIPRLTRFISRPPLCCTPSRP